MPNLWFTFVTYFWFELLLLLLLSKTKRTFYIPSIKSQYGLKVQKPLLKRYYKRPNSKYVTRFHQKVSKVCAAWSISRRVLWIDCTTSKYLFKEGSNANKHILNNVKILYQQNFILDICFGILEKSLSDNNYLATRVTLLQYDRINIFLSTTTSLRSTS